jgi:hypothetical protein
VTVVGSFTITVNEDEELEVGTILWEEFTKSDMAFSQSFGETDYLDHFVYNIGRQHLAPFNKVVYAGKIVRDVSIAEAHAAALALIEAAEQTARILPPLHGIGGPVDIATISAQKTDIERVP